MGFLEFNDRTVFAKFSFILALVSISFTIQFPERFRELEVHSYIRGATLLCILQATNQPVSPHFTVLFDLVTPTLTGMTKGDVITRGSCHYSSYIHPEARN